MKLAFAAAFLSCCSLFRAGAQINLHLEVTTRSRSDQFVVRGNLQPSRLPLLLQRAIGTNWVRLEPTLLAVSCERVKQAMLRELGAPDQWRGKIFLALHPIQSPDEAIQVTSLKFVDGWTYRLDLPDAIEPARFVRAMVNVLLVEWANRSSPDRLAGVPAWLSEGLAEQLMADSTEDLLLPPPESRPNSLAVASLMRVERKANPLSRAHGYLRQHPPLPLEQLIAPKETLLVGEDALTFRYSAQLFTWRLLELKTGGASLSAMLDGLASQTSAQIAFLRAFADHFQSLRELEEWWELQTAHFTGRDLSQAWPAEESLRKLAEILRVPVLVRTDTNSPLARDEVPLQAVLRDWGGAWQPGLVRFKIQQLLALRLRAPNEAASLADNYRQTLESFLRKIERVQSGPDIRGIAPFEISGFAKDAAGQLDRLDAKREALRKRLSAEALAGAETKP
jgi:hypothetical protein